MPIESLIYEKQKGYYKALNTSNKAGESTPFVTFKLEVIRDALRAVAESQNKLTEVGANVGENVGVNVGENVGTNVEKIVALLRQDNRLTARVLAATLNLTDRQVERILAKLKAEGKLVRRGASKNGHWEVLKEYE